jgi:hypothetical protein
MASFNDLKKIRRLAGLAATGDPQRNYMFEVGIQDTSSAGLNLTALQNILTSNDEANNIRFFSKTVSIPQKTNEPILMTRMDERFFFAGKDSSTRTIAMSLWDDESLTVMKYMHKWREYTGSSDDGRALPKSAYTKNLVIELKDSLDLLTTAQIVLTDCFPIELSDIALSYEESAPIEHTIIFSYGKMEIIFAKDLEILKSAISIGTSFVLRK